MIAETSTSVLLLQVYARMATASTWKVHINVTVTKDLNLAMIAKVALVNWKFGHCMGLLFCYDCFFFLDKRQGFCFRQLVNGRCNTHNRELKHATKADCCCSMGQAWGPRCELCPFKHSPQYQELCLDSGFKVDGQGKMYF